MSYLFINFDGKIVDDLSINEFNLRNYSRNIRFSRTKQGEVLNFVGFILNENGMFVSLPKNYALNENNINESDIQLLLNVILKNQIDNSQKYIGNKKDFESTYPFESFYNINKYYENYGIYRESNNISKPGFSGKIQWNETIRKSNKVVSAGNLIFLPMYIKEQEEKQVFLSECMAFVINYTREKFPFFIQSRKEIKHNSNFNFIENKEYVLSKLKKIHSEIFKDINKKLVINLIDFFTKVNEGGTITVKHYNFELIWESMVEKYLNESFSGISDEEMKFLGNEEIKFSKAKFNVDKAHPTNRIEPDYYFTDSINQYIFDAKYYSEISSLNFKQIVYQTLLKTKAKTTFNALIIPTHTLSFQRVHFELDEKYYMHSEDYIKIWEYNLNIKDVMINYIK